MPNFIKYGFSWPEETSPLDVEFWCIRKGKEWIESQGRSVFFHYKECWKILWPGDVEHRWFNLAFKAYCEEEIVVVMGCKDSGKTYSMSCYALIDYWCFPNNTLWMISSTEYRGCEMRIWGDIKTLFNRAKERFPDLDGHPLESMHAITTDQIDDDKELARSLKTGLILVPCKKGNQYVGLASFQGVKSPRLRHAGDEVAAMNEGFLNAYANWYGKRDFKGLMTGNPTDPEDQLCRAGEPEDGWDNFIDTGKTQTWRSKFFGALAIAFDGRDSPNDDFPDSKTPKFSFLISKKGRDAVASSFGEDSWQMHSQCIGKPNKSVLLFRVITRNQCEQNHALDDVVWSGEPTVKIYGLDPTYGGSDRCVGGQIEFGKDVTGRPILCFHEPEIISVKPVSRTFDPEPEDQIARFVKKRADDLSIPYKNIFYDANGKGTLGYAFSKEFKDDSPIPVDSGSQPTDRPVRFDLFVEDNNGKKRLMKCSEYYVKFITEAWFSVSEAIRSGQVRELPMEVMKELCLRTYKPKGDLIEIEPKDGTPNKPGFKQRIGYSPDLADWAAISVEGARQRGFKIQRIGGESPKSTKPDWATKQAKEYSELMGKRQLKNY